MLTPEIEVLFEQAIRRIADLRGWSLTNAAGEAAVDFVKYVNWRYQPGHECSVISNAYREALEREARARN